jgi:hypothetical protein
VQGDSILGGMIRIYRGLIENRQQDSGLVEKPERNPRDDEALGDGFAEYAVRTEKNSSENPSPSLFDGQEI